MEINITKRVKLFEENNDKVHNFYYLVYGKIHNDTNTRHRNFKFVVSFDAFDIQEYFDKDSYTREDVMNMVEELSYCCFLQNIVSYDDCKHFYELCNESISKYNKIVAQ